MAYPGPKVHRPSRRKLGRGQYPTQAAATVAITVVSADVAGVTFNEPMVISGPITLNVAGKTVVSQAIISSTLVQITYNGALTGLAWTFPSLQPNVATPQGGGVNNAAGTFP